VAKVKAVFNSKYFQDVFFAIDVLKLVGTSYGTTWWIICLLVVFYSFCHLWMF